MGLKLSGLAKLSGFTLISMLVALFIMGLSLSVVVSLMVRQEQASFVLDEKIAINHLKEKIIRTMTNFETCSCQFTTMKIKLDSDRPSRIALSTLRDSCETSSPDNILVKNRVPILGLKGWEGAHILVNDFQNIGGYQYAGKFSVFLKNRDKNYTLNFVSFPIVVELDPRSVKRGSHYEVKFCRTTKNVKKEATIWDCLNIDSLANQSEGKTLFGCGGTIENSHPHSTSFGFGAGVSSGAGDNTYFGYFAGNGHSGMKSTFVGYSGGELAGSAVANTVVGYHAGRKAQGGEQVLVGVSAGKESTGEQNVIIGADEAVQKEKGSNRSVILSYQTEDEISGLVFWNFNYNQEAHDNVILGGFNHAYGNKGENVTLGYRSCQNFKKKGHICVGTLAGASGSTNNRNIFIGKESGYLSGGDDNIFIGVEAGRDQSDRSEKNVFLGYGAGTTNQDNGSANADKNTFLGNGTGNGGGIWRFNTLVGANIGYTSSQTIKNNVVVGAQALLRMKDNRGNVVLGHNSLNNTHKDHTNEHSIFIGQGVERSSVDMAASSEFAVGSSDASRWLTGTIGSELYVNGVSVTPPASSRRLKKNIHPVKSIKQYVDSLIESPLFTYQYKDKNLHPKKVRMGFISEELPEHLQIKKEGQLSYPDWPSIYGSFWSSIQYLYGMLKSFQGDIFFEAKKLADHMQSFEDKQSRFMEKTMGSKKELLEMKTHLSQASQELEDTKKDLMELKESIKKNWKEVEERFPKMKKWAKSKSASISLSDGVFHE